MSDIIQFYKASTAVRTEERTFTIYFRSKSNGTPIDLTGKTIYIEMDSVDDGRKIIRTNTAPTFASTAVDTTEDTITIPDHGYADNDVTQFTTSGGLPAGLSLATNYYVIVVNKDTIKVSASYGGAAVNLTTQGTGTHSASALGASISGNAVLGAVSVTMSPEAVFDLKVGDAQEIDCGYKAAGSNRRYGKAKRKANVELL